MYVTVEEVKAFSRVNFRDLGFTNENEMDNFVSTLIGYVAALIDNYTGEGWTADNVPKPVKYVILQVCSNVLHVMLQRKISPVVQTGDFTIRVIIPEVFTAELKEMLSPYRKLRVEKA